VSLVEEARADRPIKGPRCTVAVMLDGLGGDDRAEAVAALADPAVMSSALVRAMARRGWDVPTQYVVQRHRRGECRCG
jgi:hypothetical protein